MNIEQLCEGVEKELSPYLDFEQIDISFQKKSKWSSRHTDKIDITITIFYTRASDNFTTNFYGFNPKPKSLKEIITGILEAAKEQNVPLRKPVRNKSSDILNPEVL